MKDTKEQTVESPDVAKATSSKRRQQIKEEVWEKLNDKYGGCGHLFEDTKESKTDWTKMRCASCPETIESLLDRTIYHAISKTAKAIFNDYYNAAQLMIKNCSKCANLNRSSTSNETDIRYCKEHKKLLDFVLDNFKKKYLEDASADASEL